jgi:hypothetical protein
MFFLVLAFAWAPITWHCSLEVLPVLDFLACCAHDEAAAPHQDSDCDEDGCAVVESGNYKTQDEQIVVVPPQLVSWFVHVVPARPTDETSQSVLATSPPEELRTWQFALRTALPVRAPSLAS